MDPCEQKEAFLVFSDLKKKKIPAGDSGQVVDPTHVLAATKQFPDMDALLGTASDGKCDDTHFVDGEAEV